MDNRKEILQLAEILSFRKNEEVGFIARSIENGEIDWPRLVAVANLNLLTPSLYVSLKKKRLLEKIDDSQLLAFLKEVYNANEKRNIGILEQIEDIRIILEKMQISVLILKGGATLTEKLYPEAGMRMMNDLDIMMNPDRFDKGLEQLKKNGYIEFGRDLQRWHHHTPRIDKVGFPAAVEPHFRVVYDKEREYIPFNEETSMPSRLKKKGLYVLKPTWHLYHAFLHSAVIDKNHQRWRLAMRYMYDFSILAYSYGNTVDWPALYTLAKRYGHHKIFEDFLYVAQKLFNLETPIKTNKVRGALFLKKCLWEATLEPETKLHKFYKAYVDFDEIYGYKKLKRYYGLTSRNQYPFALIRYAFYHGKKHLIE